MACWQRPLLTLYSLLNLLHQLSSSLTALVNWIVDDTGSGNAVLYFPNSHSIWKGSNSKDCWLFPDVTRTHGGTYTAATYRRGERPITLQLRFEGTAIYVFFILVNRGSAGTIMDTICNITLDNNPPKRYVHNPNPSANQFLYNQLIYEHSNLGNSSHTLNITSHGSDSSYINFDYFIVR
ncbi:hypothetical protein FA15DRAFT_598086 [Coprinopsis marcescibilis]|uniref:Uncharacterized protein n=1 Tax=Coprinopsis marcescibilis TaxID=230819 RepID=A0A5C3KLQ3_COPMA|nr:hypothetical protein FA15DRAFT_598086 [Coprinopsis marcescibilis]